MLKQDFINFIYKNSIFQLGTVQLKNGAFSDYFYNFGKVDTPDALFCLSRWLVDLVNDIEFDAVFTSAYKGITLQTGFALEYSYQFPHKKIRFGYKRKEEKSHGEEGCVIGYQPQKGDRVLLLDDVFTTGYSIEEMSKFLKSYGAIPVLAVVIVLRANEKLFSRFKKQEEIPIRYLIHDDEISAVYQQYKGNVC